MSGFSGETKPSSKIPDTILYCFFFVVVANCVMCYNNCGEQIAQAVNHIIILINVSRTCLFVCLFAFSFHLLTDESFYLSVIVSLKSNWMSIWIVGFRRLFSWGFASRF